MDSKSNPNPIENRFFCCVIFAFFLCLGIEKWTTIKDVSYKTNICELKDEEIMKFEHFEPNSKDQEYSRQFAGLKFAECEWRDVTDTGTATIMKKMIFKNTCKEIFDRWMRVNMGTPKELNKSVIPCSLYARYTLNASIPVQSYYKYDSRTPWKKRLKRGLSKKVRGVLWKEEDIEQIIDQLKGGNTFLSGYQTDSLSEAMIIHKPTGLGLVIGSIEPWVEAAALFNGADHVLTTTYNPLKSLDSRISVIHPRNMTQNYKSYINAFDFAASYSSIEHSGLGRYGDALDPEGDILEMQKVHCWLKEGGLFFFGVPFSKLDSIMWNANRVYGPLRLPYMFAGFEVLTILDHPIFHLYNGANKEISLQEALDAAPEFGYNRYQPTVVLRKIKAGRC